MWLDLNGSPSLNYIHFTCHLVFKNRNHCSLGEKKTEPASVYDMPQKGQTHLHQEYATQILERWLKRAPAALSYSLTGAACSGSGIHFKLDKQATAFKKKKKPGSQAVVDFCRSLCFPSGHYLQLYLQSDGGCASPRSGSKKKTTSNRQRRRLLFTNEPTAHQTNQEWRSAKRNRTLNEVVKILNPLAPQLGHLFLSPSRLNYWNYLPNLPHLVTFKTHLRRFMRKKEKKETASYVSLSACLVEIIDLNYVCSELCCISVNNKKISGRPVGRVGQLLGECEEAATESTELDWWDGLSTWGI